MPVAAPGGGWFRALVVSTICTQAVYNAVRVLITYKAVELGGTPVFVGVLTASYSLIPLFVAFHAGRAVDRGSPLLILWLGTSLTVVPVGVAAISWNLPVLLLANMLLGVGQSMTMVAAQGLVPQRYPPVELNRRFGQLTLGVSVGQAVGMPLVGALTAWFSESSVHPDVTVPLWGMFLLGACAVPFTLAVRVRPCGPHAEDSPEPGPQGPLTIMSHRGMKPAVFSSLAVLVAIDMLTAYLPLIAIANSITASQVTTLLTIRTLASVVSRMFISPLLTTLGSRTLLVLGTLLPGLSLLLVPVAPYFWPLSTLMVLAGFFFGVAQPLTMTWVVQSIDALNRATALAMRMVGNRLGQVGIPLIAGGMSRISGESSVFFLSAGILIAAAISTWWST